MDYKKILRAFLAKVTKKPDGDIDAILDASEATEDSVTAEILNLDKARIADITKPKTGQTFQDGYKKGKSEVLTVFETELKEKYGIESDLTGAELVEAILTEKAKTGKAKDLTDDDVRRHPIYQAAETAHKKALKAVETDWQTKLTAKELEFTKVSTFSTVSKKALDILGTLNPVLPKNATVAANLQNAFLNNLKGYEYDVQDNGSRIVVMKDGKVVDDGHGHSLEFEKLVKDNASGFFEFQVNNGGSNSGNTGGTGGGDDKKVVYPAGITKPKTFDDLAKIVNDTSIKAEDRKVVLDTWEAEQAAGTK